MHMDAPRLRTLTISTYMDGSPTLRDDSASCLHASSTRFPHLTDFEWKFYQTFSEEMGYIGCKELSSSLAELIEPLFVLRDLRNFSYCFLGPAVSLSSADLERIAEAWPSLETCLFFQDDWDCYIDFASIVALARHCSNIQIMSFHRVEFDLTANNPVMLPQDRLRLQKLSIECITLPQESTDSDPPGVTIEELRRMLQKIFPWAHLELPSQIGEIDLELPTEQDHESDRQGVTVTAV